MNHGTFNYNIWLILDKTCSNSGSIVQTTLIGKQPDQAHELAVEPLRPHIFHTCGENGLVQNVSYGSLLLI